MNNDATIQKLAEIQTSDNYVISDSASFLHSLFKQSFPLSSQKEYIEYINTSLKKHHSTIHVPLHFLPSGTKSYGLYTFETSEISVAFTGPSNMSNSLHLYPDKVMISNYGFSLPIGKDKIKIKHSIGWSGGYNLIFIAVTNNESFSYKGMTFLENTVLIYYVCTLDFSRDEAIINSQTVW